MTVVETILVYAVAPLAVIVLLALLTYLPAARNRRPRYKPGQPWNYEPVWYEPHPEHGPEAGSHDTGPKALGSSVYPELERSVEQPHGATAAEPEAATGGPLGGARGTW